MNQRGYTIAFAAVLLAVCLGAFFGGRFIYQQITGAPVTGQATWVPPEQRPAAPVAATTPAPVAVAGTPPPAPQVALGPVPTVHAILTPFVPPSPTFEPIETDVPATLTVAEDITVTVTLTPVPNLQYVLAAPVRATNGDCAGNLILGRVLDRNGKPVAGLRMHLTDEYGAENTVKISKTEAADLGRYDFPLSGPGRTYYLTIEDGTSHAAISERVEVQHGVGPTPKASCHWVDWKQR